MGPHETYVDRIAAFPADQAACRTCGWTGPVREGQGLSRAADDAIAHATSTLPPIPDPLVVDHLDGCYDVNGNEWLDFDLDEPANPAIGLLDPEPTCAVCGAVNVRQGFAAVSDASPSTDVRVVCASHLKGRP